MKRIARIAATFPVALAVSLAICSSVQAQYSAPTGLFMTGNLLAVYALRLRDSGSQHLAGSYSIYSLDLGRGRGAIQHRVFTVDGTIYRNDLQLTLRHSGCLPVRARLVVVNPDLLRVVALGVHRFTGAWSDPSVPRMGRVSQRVLNAAIEQLQTEQNVERLHGLTEREAELPNPMVLYCSRD